MRGRTGCSVPGCERRHEAHGLCALHYTRAKQGKPTHGKITGGSPPAGATAIPGYEQYYSATPDGRIFSNDYRRTGEAKELAQSTHPEGYKRVKAYFVDKHHGTPVHRLIALAFIPNPFNLPQVNHINGKKGDNRVENLEWCDNAWNQKHAFLSGLHIYAKGEAHPMAKMNEVTAKAIKRRLQDPFYIGQLADIAKEHGVSMYSVFDIKRGKTWRHV